MMMIVVVTGSHGDDDDSDVDDNATDMLIAMISVMSMMNNSVRSCSIEETKLCTKYIRPPLMGDFLFLASCG